MADAADGNPVPYPKEITAALMLWDVEAIVAYIEPILFGIADAHRSLLSLRARIRWYIHHLILDDAWFEFKSVVRI